MSKSRLSNVARRIIGGSSRGMTLIEVVIALALFTIIAITFLSGLTVAARAVFIGDVRTTSESLARTQMEYVKSQGYTPATAYDPDDPESGHASYNKTEDIQGIAPGYAVWSANRTGHVLNGGPDDPIIAGPWDSQNSTVAATDIGLQKITLVIKHEGKVIFTLEGYKARRES